MIKLFLLILFIGLANTEWIISQSHLSILWNLQFSNMDACDYYFDVGDKIIEALNDSIEDFFIANDQIFCDVDVTSTIPSPNCIDPDDGALFQRRAYGY